MVDMSNGIIALDMQSCRQGHQVLVELFQQEWQKQGYMAQVEVT